MEGEGMSRIFLGQRVADCTRQGVTVPISRVTLIADDNASYTAGTDAGAELSASCPWATQEMADRLLTEVAGKSIAGFSASGAQMDPAAELGDGVTVGGVYAPLGALDTTCGAADTAALACGVTGEVEQEYITVGEIERKILRMRQSITQLTVQAGEIKGEITDVEQELSSQVTQTAAQLTTQIDDAKTQMESRLTQTSDSLTSQISKAEQAVSTIAQKVDNISLSVENGEDRSRITLSVDGVEVSSKTIKFQGDVVFESDLQAGNTSIDGACIDTGEIDVERIYMHGQMEVDDNEGSHGGYIGYCAGYSDDGIGVMHSASTGQCICTNAGAKLAYADNQFLGVSKLNIYASQAISVGSDRRIKHGISYDLDPYEALYRALRPCRYQLNDGTSGRYHTGFIAQDLETAVAQGGLTTQDFAALVVDETGRYSVRYTELIALNTAMIQSLLGRVDALEAKIKALENGKEVQ